MALRNVNPGSPVSDRIRRLMATRRVTQAQLGATLDLPQAGVSSRLAGRTDWRLAELQTVADTLAVPLTELIGAEDPTPAGPAPAAPISSP